jgi:ketosteroid isomerase-like protein
MAADDPTALVRRYLEDGQANDTAAFDELFAADFVSHRPNGGEDRGPDGLRAFIAGLHARLPGLETELLELFADGPMVAARIAIRGTWAATGAPFALTEMQLWRVAGGKLAERWYAVNRAGLPRPAPAAPATA